MKKVSIIYWSNGGNVEVLANEIANGARENGADVLIKLVQNAKVEDVVSADSVAMGSPSMDGNKIEQHEMAPFVEKFKLLPNENKTLALFGSYGWDNGEFMEEWTKQMKGYAFNVVENLAIKESPTDEELKRAYELGEKLAK